MPRGNSRGKAATGDKPVVATSPALDVVVAAAHSGKIPGGAVATLVGELAGTPETPRSDGTEVVHLPLPDAVRNDAQAATPALDPLAEAITADAVRDVAVAGDAGSPLESTAVPTPSRGSNSMTQTYDFGTGTKTVADIPDAAHAILTAAATESKKALDEEKAKYKLNSWQGYAAIAGGVAAGTFLGVYVVAPALGYERADNTSATVHKMAARG